jgi:hypothetical protein
MRFGHWARNTLAVCLSVGTLMALPVVPATAAQPGAVRTPACGVVFSGYAAGQWLGGHGVDVNSNGVKQGTGENCDGGSNSVYGTPTGGKWQCVELINRLWLTLGWTNTTWTGDGNQLYERAPLGMERERNGAISYVGPGDVISMNTYRNRQAVPGGHAGVVDTAGRVTSGTIPMVSQNSGDATWALPRVDLTLKNATLTRKGGGGFSYQVIGVVHAPIPTVTGIEPASGIAGTVVVITGSHLLSATEVHVGTKSAPAIRLNDTQMETIIPPASPGTVDITVSTPAGTSQPVNAARFTYEGPVTVRAASGSGTWDRATDTTHFAFDITVDGGGGLIPYLNAGNASDLTWVCRDPDTGAFGGSGGFVFGHENLVAEHSFTRDYHYEFTASGAFFGDCHGTSLLLTAADGSQQYFPTEETLAAAGFPVAFTIVQT